MRENKKPENILALSPEMLEQVAGGVMTDRAEVVLDALIKALKKDTAAVHTPEETIEFVTSKLMSNVNFENVTEKDVEEYVLAHWND